jgi:hypothetical protein
LTTATNIDAPPPEVAVLKGKEAERDGSKMETIEADLDHLGATAAGYLQYQPYHIATSFPVFAYKYPSSSKLHAEVSIAVVPNAASTLMCLPRTLGITCTFRDCLTEQEMPIWRFTFQNMARLAHPQ